jgi:D-lactate dehydrogenase
MRVIAEDIRPQPGLEEKLGFCYASLDELLRGSHIISLHVPLTADTYHLLDRAAFRKCRRGVIIVNTARGRLIDTDALTEALDQGVVGGAGLDVIEEERVMTRDWSKIAAERIIKRLHAGGAAADSDSPDPQRGGELGALIRNQSLIARPNVVFTPHIAFNSVEAVARINETTIHNIRSFLSGKPVNLVSQTRDAAEGLGTRPKKGGRSGRDRQTAPSARPKKDQPRQTRTP